MEKQFRELEESFDHLKNRFTGGDISRQQYIDELKKLRLKDDEGRFWMIGAQSGKWYFYDGKAWRQSDPPSVKERKAICIYCGYENDITAEVCVRCGGNIGGGVTSVCPKCGYKLDDPSQDCPHCSREADEEHKKMIFMDKYQPQEGESERENKNMPLIFRSISPLSFFVFFGLIGLVAGIVFGAFVGASSYFPGVMKILPGFLQSLEGKFLGGIVLAGLGGIAGFIALGIFGFIEAGVINIISSIAGGMKIRFTRVG